MPFKSEKQRRWMHLHHPEIAGDWEKKYKDGGFVEKAKEASKQGDVVDAKLTPLEVILNAEHLAALQEETGIPVEKTFQKIGVPGFETGTFQARGGGAASKKDYLMRYQTGGTGGYGTDEYDYQPGYDFYKGIGGDMGMQDYVDMNKANVAGELKVNKPWRSSDDPWTLVTQGTGKHKFFDTKEDWQQHGEMLKEKYFTPKPTTQGKPMSTKKYEGMAGGGTAKKEYLMGYKNGGVPVQQSLNVPSPEYEGIIPPERRVTQYATPRPGVEAYYDMSRINYTPSDTEKVPGVKGWLQRALPGGKTGREGRKMTNEEKEEVYRASRYGDQLPESNPYYNMLNSPLNPGNEPSRRYSSKGYRYGGTAKKKKKQLMKYY